jgi:ubiquinone/menaquinone biosynthesis C-methylase UbiE
MSEPIPREAQAYYDKRREAERLFGGHGVIELARTQEIILRHLSPPPGTVLDVGGGSGVYACWLASLGYRVHLIDAMPLHVEQAEVASARQPRAPLASCRLGDARRLEDPDAAADAVLLLGPLYHLTERPERVLALREAARVLKPGGLLVAAAVGRFASLLDGIADNLMGDPDYAAIVAQDLRDGQHRNPTERNYFTTAYFHLPQELEDEVGEAGFERMEVLGVEGPGWMLADLEARWADPIRRQQILDAARAIEREPALMGVHAHILAIGRKPT